MTMPKNPKALQSVIEQLAVKAATHGFIMFSSDLTLEGYDHFAAIDTALNVEPEKRPYRYGASPRHTSFVARQHAVERAYASVGR